MLVEKVLSWHDCCLFCVISSVALVHHPASPHIAWKTSCIEESGCKSDQRSRLWCWHCRARCSRWWRWWFKTWTPPKPFWKIWNWLSFHFSSQLLDVFRPFCLEAFPRSPQHWITEWIGVFSLLLRFTWMDRDCVVCWSTFNVRQILWD